MNKIIPLVIFSALVCSMMIHAQNLGMNCAEDCRNKLKSCKASCSQIIFKKHAYNTCLDNCDDAWRECRKKCN